MLKRPPRHEVVSLPLNAERPIGASMSFFATRQAEPEFDMHYGLEMGVVLQGRMRRWSGERAWDLERGQPWFVGMWEPHGAQAVKAPCRVLVMTIWPPLLAGIHFAEAPAVEWMQPFACAHDGPFVLGAAHKRELLRLSAEVLSVCASSDAISRSRLRLLLLESLLVALASSQSKVPARRKQHRVGSLSPALELALTQQRPIRVGEAARVCGLGRERFMREFRTLMGLSFAQFALRQRLHGAATDLLTTDEPIKALAWRWGFTDESHLHRLFVQHYRCTPKAYRLGR